MPPLNGNCYGKLSPRKRNSLIELETDVKHINAIKLQIQMQNGLFVCYLHNVGNDSWYAYIFQEQ